MTARVSTASLLALIVEQNAKTDARLDALAAQVAGQHSTPAPVADAVSLTKPAKAAKVEPVVVKSASDQAYEFVQSKGLAFARGGRTLLSTEALKAAITVLKTGTPVVITQEGLGSLDKRKITGVCMFRSDDGKAVVTQYVYTPEA